MLGRPEALAGLGGLAYCWGNAPHPPALRSNTLRTPLGAEVLAAWGHHYSQHLTPTESAMQEADDCVWQVDDLQLSTAPPRSLSYNFDIWLVLIARWIGSASACRVFVCTNCSSHPKELAFPGWGSLANTAFSKLRRLACPTGSTSMGSSSPASVISVRGCAPGSSLLCRGLVPPTGEALCGETGFCCGFWTPNWCPQKSLFSIP